MSDSPYQNDDISEANRILERITDAFYALDSDWRFTYVNAQAETLLGRLRVDLLGKSVWDEFPEAVQSKFFTEYQRAVSEQVAVTVDEYYPPLSIWFEVRAYPSPDGLSVYFRDITSVKMADAERLLQTEDERDKFMLLAETSEEFIGMCNMQGIPFYVNPAAIRLIGLRDMEHARLSHLREYFFPEDVDFVFNEFLPKVLSEGHAEVEIRLRNFTTGEPVLLRWNVFTLSNASGDPTGFGTISRDVTVEKKAREELIGAHRRTSSILESITDAFFAIDRDWRFTYVNTQAELLLARTRGALLGKSIWDEFPEAVGSNFDLQYRLAIDAQIVVSFEDFYSPLSAWFEVTAYPSQDGLSVYFRDIGERKVLEAEQARLANANKLLLDSSRDGIYSIDADGKFTTLNRAAASMLGYTQDEVYGIQGHELIHHSYSDGTHYPVDDCPILLGLRTGRDCHIEDDVFWRKNGTPFPVAYSASPILVDGVVQGAVITFIDISERKALYEAREMLFERERNIAEQLQMALQPDLPGNIPGLDVAKYYEAALTHEAGVGGDFYDVFSIEKGCTALVVGDLSGKGLAAAAQVATVRNMLRAFLYSMRTVADAVMHLNRVLIENNLLSGFATLFVGAYDSSTQILKYVNCGQEPALLRRVSQENIEVLSPTGPIIGSIENAKYADTTVTLADGDVLAIFSDGLTEAGPSRNEMLGVEGVTRMLAEGYTELAAEGMEDIASRLAIRMIDGVYKAAKSAVMRDDLCLLVVSIPPHLP